jgi:hypothetical protein
MHPADISVENPSPKCPEGRCQLHKRSRQQMQISLGRQIVKNLRLGPSGSERFFNDDVLTVL